jgi:hypothetical protein
MLIASGLVAEAEIGERHEEEPAKRGEPDHVLHGADSEWFRRLN